MFEIVNFRSVELLLGGVVPLAVVLAAVVVPVFVAVLEPWFKQPETTNAVASEVMTVKIFFIEIFMASLR